MKRTVAAAVLIFVLLTLSGCRSLSEWEKAEETQKGIVAVEVKSDQDTKESWYSLVDTEESTILSVNLIYPEEYGEPTETKCLVGGKKTEISVSRGEREKGGVLFYSLPFEYSQKDSDSKIEIIQKFGNKEVVLYYRPCDIFSALEVKIDK